MEKVLENKLFSLLKTRDFLFADYSELSPKVSLADLNMSRIRGSVRLGGLRVVLPNDLNRAKRKVLDYSYR